MTPIPTAAEAWVSMGEALLIGLLIGIQREGKREEVHAGLRDFLLIGLAGGLCGLLQQAWLTGSCLLAITVFLGLFRFQHPERTGVTTELTAVATFLLALLATWPAYRPSAQVAVGLCIVVVALLETKRSLERLVLERISETEFKDTLRFLAVIFIVYPVLPEGAFGPYGFLAPRRIWMFVILVSSVSYTGYFLVKFLGAQRGLLYMSVLGGLASTTAATTAFARDCRDDPEQEKSYAWAAVLANAIQFPRLLVLVAALAPELARAAAPILLLMMASGLAVGIRLRRDGRNGRPEAVALGLRNPFRLLSAVQFGGLFAAILLVTKWAAAEYGSRAMLVASGLAGALDTDAVLLSLADLFTGRGINERQAEMGILLALAANAAVKTLIAYGSGTAGFGNRVLLGFGAMFAGGLLGSFWL